MGYYPIVHNGHELAVDTSLEVAKSRATDLVKNELGDDALVEWGRHGDTVHVTGLSRHGFRSMSLQIDAS